MKAASVTLDPGALASMELFRELPPAALDDVIKQARLRRLAKDTRIFEQGSAAGRCHALIDGRVRVAQSGSGGGQVVIRFVGPGEMFGTVALFTDRKYPAEAVTLMDSIEISWSEAALLELIGRHPRIALNLVRIVGKRLKEAQERVRELATLRVEQRVARALLRLASQAGQDTGGGTKIDIPLTRKDLAELSGTTLHTVSRILTAWEREDLVVTNNQRVTIRNFSEIKRIAQDHAD